ncbi:hypothetical protein ADL27_32575 [Streptomyces sp. NRRL F-6602]|nr:hypothetical protein ADL27_32575 [Streptomyces sp. NRRL F-6602]
MKRIQPIIYAILVIAIAAAYMVGKHNATTENTSPTNKDTVKAFNDGWLDGNRDLAEQIAKLAKEGCENPQIELQKDGPAEVACLP